MKSVQNGPREPHLKPKNDGKVYPNALCDAPGASTTTQTGLGKDASRERTRGPGGGKHAMAAEKLAQKGTQNGGKIVMVWKTVNLVFA